MKILLLDTNVSSYPIFQYLNNIGADVYVVGNNDNDFLAKISSNFVKLNYSDIESLTFYLRNNDFDYIVPGCNDVSYDAYVKLSCNGFGFHTDSIDVNLKLNDKVEFNNLAIKNHLKHPKSYALHDKINFDIPKIIKPADSYSGKGISIISSEGEIDSAYCNALSNSPSGKVVIQDFIQGQLFSHSAFIRDRKVVLDFVVQEDCTINPFAVDTSRVLQIDDNLLNIIRSNVNALAEDLNLSDGLFHSQFILQCDVPWFIEVTRRCPGDLYSLLIERSTGIRYAELYTNTFIDIDSVFPKQYSIKPIIRSSIKSNVSRTFAGIKICSSFEGFEFYPIKSYGDIIDPNKGDRVGILFLSFDNLLDLDVCYEKFLANNAVVIL